MKNASNDMFVENITKVLVNVSDEKGYKFSLSNKELQNDFLFNYRALLPMFLLEAKEIYEKIFNKQFTAQELLDTVSLKKEKKSEIDSSVPKELIERDAEALAKKPVENEFPLQLFVTEPDITLFDFEPRIEHLRDAKNNVNFGMISMCSMYALEEYAKKYEETPALLVNGRIPLDPLCKKWFDKLNENPKIAPIYSLEEVQAIDAKKVQRNSSSAG